jgi:hypothetical protein
MSAVRRGAGLRAKATVGAVCVTSLALAAVAAANIVETRTLLRLEQARAGAGLARSLARSCEAALARGDRRELDDVSKAFLDRNTLFNAVYDRDDRLVAGAIRDQEAWWRFVGGETVGFALAQDPVLDRRTADAPVAIGRVLVALSRCRCGSPPRATRSSPCRLRRSSLSP